MKAGFSVAPATWSLYCSSSLRLSSSRAAAPVKGVGEYLDDKPVSLADFDGDSSLWSAAESAEDGEGGEDSRCLLRDWVARAASAVKVSTETGSEGIVGCEVEDEKGGASVATGPFSDAMSSGNDHQEGY